jgi:hypothetical protein
MKARNFIVPIIFFLFFSAFFLKGADAGIFDTVTPASSNYRLVQTTSGAIAVSNMITHDNQVEIVYSTLSGISNLVLTNTSGGWSANTYTVSSDVLNYANNGYSLIQNATDLHLFYCNVLQTKHYRALKSDHVWTLVEQDFGIPFFGGYCSIGDTEFIFDKNDNKTIYGIWTLGYTSWTYNLAYWANLAQKDGTTGIWTNTGGYGFCTANGCVFSNGGSQFSIAQSSQTNNRFISYTSTAFGGCYTPYLGWSGEKKIMEITTLASISYGSLNAVCDSLGNGNSHSSVLPFKNIDAEYYANIHASNSFELSYVFDTSDTLGVSCASTYRNNFYACNETIPYSYPSYGFAGTSVTTPIREDAYGNLHILYTTNVSGDNALSHIYQDNSTYNWIFEKVINITGAKSFADFVLYGNDIMVYEVSSGSGDIHFWYQSGASPAPPVPPAPPPSPAIPAATSDNTFMGLICNGGVYLTGTTFEGGCLVSSLFMLAIFLSVVGWLFKYIELEFDHKIPDKYLVSGLISLGLIITFAVIGIADLVTTILGFFMITAVLIAYYERGAEKK